MSWLLLAALVGADPGPQVTLSGVISHTGSGALRLEVLQIGEPGSPPLLVSAVDLPGAGPFSIQVPAELGAVRLRVAYDPAGDGVGPDDAQAVSAAPFDVRSKDVTDLMLSLTRPDLRSSTGGH